MVKYLGNIKYDDRLSVAQEIVLCGGGEMLLELINCLEKKEILDKVIAICDADINKVGIYINNIKIDTYERVISLYPEAEYIVYNRFKKDIFIALCERGVENIHIILEF